MMIKYSIFSLGALAFLAAAPAMGDNFGRGPASAGAPLSATAVAPDQMTAASAAFAAGVLGAAAGVPPQGGGVIAPPAKAPSTAGNLPPPTAHPLPVNPPTTVGRGPGSTGGNPVMPNGSGSPGSRFGSSGGAGH